MRSEADQLVAEAIVLAEAASTEAAIPLFQRAVALEPGRSAVHEMLAQCCMEAGQHEAAYAAAAEAARLLAGSSSGAAEALVTLGRAARNVGRLKEAAAAFEAALSAAQGGRASAGSPGRSEEPVGGGNRSDGGPQASSSASIEAQEVRQELHEVELLREQEVG